MAASDLNLHFARLLTDFVECLASGSYFQMERYELPER